MNANELVASIERQLRAAEDEAASNKASARRIVNAVKADGRAELTEAESADVDRLIDRAEAAVKRRASLEGQLSRARTVAAEDAEYLRVASEVYDTPAAKRMARMSDRTATLSIGRNERTYNPDTDKRAGDKPGASFLLDVGKAFLGDPLAADRLARHQREEFAERPGLEERVVGVGTGAFTGLVVPQYTVDLYAPAVAAGRPFADVCAHHDLPPEGMSVNISRITTASSAALQSAELAAVSWQDMDDTLLTLPVLTAAGQQLASRQAIERGNLVEQVITGDLLRRVATNIDSTLLNQTATGLSFAATGQTWTQGTPWDTTIVPAFLKQMISAANTVETNLLSQAPASHYILHPRRFRWLTAAVSANWPQMSGLNAPPQSSGVILTNEYPGVKAVMADGTKIVVDANISTTCLAGALTGGTQDFAFCVAAEESHLWEDVNAPIMIRAEQPSAASLGVLFVAYSYFAFTHSRYPGSAVNVNGTGLTAPSFA